MTAGILGALALGACSRSPRPVPAGAAPPAFAQAVGASPSPPPENAPTLPKPHPPLCGDPGHVLLFAAPAHPVRGKAMSILAVTDQSVDAELAVTSPGGVAVDARNRQGGPPYYWLAQVHAPPAGTWHVALSRDDACGGGILGKRDVVVRGWPIARAPAPPGELWATRTAWSPSLENMYSVWIQHLFDAPLDAQPSYSALHELLRDRARNLLFDYLGAGEDEQGIVVRPDCADLPYFLRAYFSFKLGLPFGWSRCSRGEGGTPPTCADFATNIDPFPAIVGKPQAVPLWANGEPHGDPRLVDAKRFGEFLRTTLADAAQSGAGRTPATDETGDYYPVALSVDTLRPGTIFADPYGHVLVVAKRVEQTQTQGGVLLAVDGQPDGTVARKRFWRGNFLFAIDPSLGSPGFKRFRPIVQGKAGTLRHLGNAALSDYSLDQYSGGVEGFYDQVEDVLSPAALDPTQALLETIQALEEQVKTRVVSVENGRLFLASGKPAAEMPDGARIFEAAGDWEDFSTPSRDLRLLIAIDVTRALPSRVARRTERYAMPTGKSASQVQRDLEGRIARELHDRNFKYTRSDGSDWELRLADVVDRQTSLEMAYNPNDCVEERWGAPAASVEASTCKAHPPEAQLEKMQAYRAWFHERTRPPR